MNAEEAAKLWANQTDKKIDKTTRLFKQRFKCLQNFPGNQTFKIGEIYSGNTWDLFTNEGTSTSGHAIKFSFNPELFPMIFKKLEWWEERTEDELPEFLRYNTRHSISRLHNLDGKVIKPFKYLENKVNVEREQWFQKWFQVYISEEDFTGSSGSTQSLSISHFLPATEVEFINQNNKVELDLSDN